MSFFDQFTKKAEAPAKTAAKSGKAAVAKVAPKAKQVAKKATQVVKKAVSAAPQKATRGWLGGEGGSSTNLDKWYGES